MQRFSTKQKNRKIKITIPVLVVGVVIFTFIISRFFLQLMIIQGDSMSPAYNSGQFVLLDKWTGAYEVDDVVAFKSDNLNGVLVKRIAAGPEDRVVIRGGKLLVNDELQFFYEAYDFAFSGLLNQEVTLGENEYIVIGDNIEESKDSRYDEVGIVYKRQLIGRVI